MTTTELLARRERLLGTGTPLFYQEAVNIVRGKGVWLFDADGRRYLDMYNNVPCVGHCHPHVVEAMHRQASTLNVHSRYLHEGVLDYAERLTNLHAEELASVVFTCTGTEANEVAMSMARIVTGGRGLICTDAAYHGNSAEVGKLTRARDGDPEIRAIPYPQRYRPLREDVPESELTDLYLSEVRTAIDSFAANNIPFAGMLVCPILANEGLPDIPNGFRPRAAEMVRDAGGLFIADEVQAGFCRTGKWWGYEVMDFVPDIVTTGKPMGNGLPLAATVARTEPGRRFPRAETLLQHLCFQPVTGSGGYGGARDNRNRKLTAERRPCWRISTHPTDQIPATLPHPWRRFAGTACSSGWSG